MKIAYNPSFRAHPSHPDDKMDVVVSFDLDRQSKIGLRLDVENVSTSESEMLEKVCSSLLEMLRSAPVREIKVYGEEGFTRFLKLRSVSFLEQQSSIEDAALSLLFSGIVGSSLRVSDGLALRYRELLSSFSSGVVGMAEVERMTAPWEIVASPEDVEILNFALDPSLTAGEMSGEYKNYVTLRVQRILDGHPITPLERRLMAFTSDPSICFLNSFEGYSDKDSDKFWASDKKDAYPLSPFTLLFVEDEFEELIPHLPKVTRGVLNEISILRIEFSIDADDQRRHKVVSYLDLSSYVKTVLAKNMIEFCANITEKEKSSMTSMLGAAIKRLSDAGAPHHHVCDLLRAAEYIFCTISPNPGSFVGLRILCKTILNAPENLLQKGSLGGIDVERAVVVLKYMGYSSGLMFMEVERKIGEEKALKLIGEMILDGGNILSPEEWGELLENLEEYSEMPVSWWMPLVKGTEREALVLTRIV